MTNTLKTVRDNLRTYVLWGVLLSLIIIPIAAAMTIMALHEGDSSKPYVPTLRKIADETPLYSGFHKTGENVTLKDGMAYFSNDYQCDAAFSDIQAFYARVLPQQGWTPPKHVNSFPYDMNDDHYRRGEYFIAVEQDNQRSTSFSLVFIWARQ